MNNFQINYFLETLPVFRGCFPADKIPQTDIYPFSVVVNTDKEGYSGTHWVAIYASSPKTVEYFDSFGDPPNTIIGNYLLRFERIHLNKSVIQSILSDACGQFCIYFIIQRALRVPYSIILRRLLRAKNANSYVKNFVGALESV